MPSCTVSTRLSRPNSAEFTVRTMADDRAMSVSISAANWSTVQSSSAINNDSLTSVLGQAGRSMLRLRSWGAMLMGPSLGRLRPPETPNSGPECGFLPGDETPPQVLAWQALLLAELAGRHALPASEGFDEGRDVGVAQALGDFAMGQAGRAHQLFGQG